MRYPKAIWMGCFVVGLLAVSGCSIQKMAMNSVADTLSQPGEVFTGDEDPKLVGDALPFSLKLMESIREGAPEHIGLHVALASGFTQYAYGWVLFPAEKLESTDFKASQTEIRRASKLFLRANRYAWTALELAHPGFQKAYQNDRPHAMAMLTKEDVASVYWFAGSLAMAIKTDLMNTDLLQRLDEAGAMLLRALELDESFGNGMIHEALVSYYVALGESRGGGLEKAKPHYDRALTLSEGKQAGIYLTWAENFSVLNQNRDEFIDYCQKALAVDLEKAPAYRLSNTLMQQRAAWLLGRVDDLIL